jgi:hypothetical protein
MAWGGAVAALAGGLLWCVSGALAAENDAIPGLVGVVDLKGRCLRVVLGGQDVTRNCNGALSISVYADHRAGFHFAMGNGHIISISGLPEANGNANVIVVDRVVLNEGLETNKPQTFTASGRCSYGDPYKGRMTIRCNGSFGKSTDFTAAFETDGKPPA